MADAQIEQRPWRHRAGLGTGLALVLATALAAAPEDGPKPEAPRDPDVGRAYRVPYRLTATNHFLVRLRVNGKGPFNFLVDTGAPAIFVSTEAAKKAGLKADPEAFWTTVGRLDVEGGAVLRDVKVRVEDPYQLVGMNALGLPGASIDGLLGFTALARFRIELDPTKDRMTWTRLAFNPPDPPAPRRNPGARPPAELQAMNALGGVAKFAAVLIGRQPEDVLLPRGSLGMELDDAANGVRVARVLPGSPAAKAGVRDGDQLVRVNGRPVGSAKEARKAAASVRPGDVVGLSLRGAGDQAERSCDVTAGEGF